MIPEVTKGKLVYGLDEDTTVWKKAIVFSENYYGWEYAIVKLTIPKDAKVVLSPHKCRASYAKVEGIYPIEPFEPTEPLVTKIAYSYFKYPFIFSYQVGEVVYPHWFSLDPTSVCNAGIHFFRTYDEAVEYEFN